MADTTKKVTKPIMLDETGKQMVVKQEDIVEYILNPLCA